ncbi:MAG TPA: ZIP family metal transporter [Acidobacteriaceae bacterium]|nr:ZIP family metal transporter [Acidobacteriaceae bacterium]
MPSLLFTLPVFSTLAGGLLALRLRSLLKLLIAFSVGLLLGAAFLDLLPEAIVLQRFAGAGISTVFGLTILSFLFFLVSQSVFDAWIESSSKRGLHRTWGRVGGGLLVAHSFRDGMAIGLSYAASHQAGYIVTIGIAAHDIGDGVNTILLSTRGEKPATVDYLLLAADCIAPLAGALSTGWFHFSATGSSALLAIAAGFFLHMVADELLPQLRDGRSLRLSLLAAIIAGAAFIYIANLLMM